MTMGEMKFALQVEMVLNRIPQPEYRQLMVEAMMVFCLIVSHDDGKTQWNEVIHVDRIVRGANEIFIDEQVRGGFIPDNEYPWRYVWLDIDLTWKCWTQSVITQCCI